MKKIILYALSVIMSVLLIGCHKDDNFTTKETIQQFQWEDLDWISEMSACCFNQYVISTDTTINIVDSIFNFCSSCFSEHKFRIPAVNDSISDNEKYFYNTINQYISDYSIASNIVVDFIDSIPLSPYFIKLTNSEKIRVAVFSYTILGVSHAVSELQSGSKQPPRTSYNSANGDSRFERQLSSCLSYQLDGHFETLVGKMAYIASIPSSVLIDVAICGNEIYVGMWNHVK